MAISRRDTLRLTATAFAAPALSRSGFAQARPVTLKLHHGLPPIANPHARLLTPWAQKIEQDSGGALRIVIYPSMQLGGVSRDLYDQARDGIADIVWTMPGATPERFSGIETFELPFIADRHGTVNAKAVQEFYSQNLREEFRDVRLLAAFAYDGCLIHTGSPVKSLDDVKGLKLHPPTRLAGEALKALGAHPVAAPLSQVGDLLANRIMDGCIVPWDIAPVARAVELTKFHAAFDGTTLATATFLLAMNKAKYDALPSGLRAVLDNNSGQHFANLAGAMFDERAAAVEEMVKKRGHIVSEFTGRETDRWRKAVEPMIHAWIRQMKERGLNGEKLLAEAKRAVAKYANA